jgi:transposase
MPRCIPTLRRELPRRLEQVPILLRPLLREAYERLIELQRQLEAHTRHIQQLVQADPVCSRLMRERGIGPICASAYVASIGDPTRYRNGRQVSASIGIVPRQHSSGGKPTLLGISKRGDRYLRTLLIHGARAVIRHVPGKTDPLSRWLQQLIARRGVNRAAVALANKTARRLWAIWRAEQPQLTA